MTSSIKYAKLFRNGNSQAVRLPQEFRFSGNQVRIRRLGNAVLLEPAEFDLEAWFAEMDRQGPLEIERDQPAPQKGEGFD